MLTSAVRIIHPRNNLKRAGFYGDVQSHSYPSSLQRQRGAASNVIYRLTHIGDPFSSTNIYVSGRLAIRAADDKL